MNLEEYLDRIKFKKEIGINVETLVELHSCHVLSIPFEDLDIHLNRPIKLSSESIFEKVVVNHRGGFCYELNYLFYTLLKGIGFDCKVVSSRIYNENENVGPEFDHMSIIVKLRENWLVDVGYGDLFIEPLKIVDGDSKKDWFKVYRLDKIGKTKYLLSESRDGREFRKRYEFDERPRQVEEFYDQCEFKQYSDESYFVKNRVCTIPTQSGRITIFNDRLIKRRDGRKDEYEIKSEMDFDQILRREFKIELTPLQSRPRVP